MDDELFDTDDREYIYGIFDGGNVFSNRKSINYGYGGRFGRISERLSEYFDEIRRDRRIQMFDFDDDAN